MSEFQKSGKNGNRYKLLVKTLGENLERLVSLGGHYCSGDDQMTRFREPPMLLDRGPRCGRHS